MQTEETKSNKHLSGSFSWEWVGFCCSVGLIAWYLFGLKAFFSNSMSIAEVIGNAWFAGGVPSEACLIPLIVTYLIVHILKKAQPIGQEGSLHGLWLVGLGAFIALAAVRTVQMRLGIFMLVPLMGGLIQCYWGNKVVWKSLFSLSLLILMSLPPGVEQATVWMQLLATKGAHWGAGLFGVDTIVEGTNILSASGKWDAFNIAGGCSGMNSLKSLLMLALPWAILADKLRWWKRCILVLSTIPQAIVANAFRVSSIFILAEYVNPAFAGKTWHDWSGLTLFFPACLIGLFAIHSLLMGELLLFKKRKVVIRNNQGKENA